jgi:serine/threonine protein kinase
MVVTAEDGTETLKIADFGLAKVREGFELAPGSAHTQTGFIVGTPPYMSPEQASGTDVDGRSDIYSLGIVLYELFTGRLPFRSDTPIGMLMHHLQTPPEAPQGLGAPKALADFLERALAKKREDRFETVEKMDEALRLLSLMPLPEFVGQGIKEGFDPKWTGSIHASRLTTVQASAPPKAGAVVRSGGQDPRFASTRALPASGARPRTVVRKSETGRSPGA